MNIYDLVPFQEEYIRGDEYSYNLITRVPGGWVYKTFLYDKPYLDSKDELQPVSVSAVFIPNTITAGELEFNLFNSIQLPIH